MPGFAARPGAAAPPPAAGQQPDDPNRKRTVTVAWGESMTFDGSVAVFQGQARTMFQGLTATPAGPVKEWVSLHCDRMTVTLSEPVTFAEMEGRRGRRASRPDSRRTPG